MLFLLRTLTYTTIVISGTVVSNLAINNERIMLANSYQMLNSAWYCHVKFTRIISVKRTGSLKRKRNHRYPNFSSSAFYIYVCGWVYLTFYFILKAHGQRSL